MTKQLVEDPVRFWEERHQIKDAWQSGGDKGISSEENREFYAIRYGRVLELIRRHHSAERPLSILDAGCGRGHLTNLLRKCGHNVAGIDSSETAIQQAQSEYGDGFAVCRLDEYRPRGPLDVVVCMDVLFHVVHEEDWKRALRAFSRYLRTEGTLILTDVFGEERYCISDYIVHRTRVAYDEQLGPMGFACVAIEPYYFGANRNGFGVFRRRL